MNQQQVIQIQMMEQEGQQLNEQLQLIEHNIKEMTELKESLNEIEKGGKDILANLGKKIYIPVEIKDKKLIVEVGKGNFVKKNIADTKKIIDGQIERLSDGRGQVMSLLEELQGAMMNIVGEIEGESERNRK